MRHWLVCCAMLGCAADEGARSTTGFGGSLTGVGSGAGTTTDGGASTSSGSSLASLDDAGTTMTPGSTDASSTSTAATDGGATDGGGFNCPGVGPLDCSPGPGSGENDTCTKPGSCFLGTVKSAVNGVIAAHPEWFDLGDGNPYVLEVEAYMNQVVADVAATGLCAIRDPNAGDEIAVKHDAEYAENFDILTAEGYARSGDGIYTSTCAPAWF